MTRRSPAHALLGIALGAVAGALVPGCGGDNALRNALDAYEGEVDPLVRKEQDVKKRLADLLRSERDRDYFDYLASDGKPFYEAFREQVQGVDPGHAEVRVAHDFLLKLADARLEFVNASLQTRELPRHLRNVERVTLAEADANLANRAYVDALGNEPHHPSFTEITQISDAFAAGYMRRLGAGEIDRSEVVDRLGKHVLPRLVELRNRKYADEEVAQLARRAVVACEKYHETILAEIESIAEALTSRRKTQRAWDRAEEHLGAFLEELKKLRRKR